MGHIMARKYQNKMPVGLLGLVFTWSSNSSHLSTSITKTDLIFHIKMFENLKGRPRHKWEYIIRMDNRKIWWQFVDWIRLAQDKNSWRAVVDTEMNLRFPQRAWGGGHSRLAEWLSAFQQGLCSMEWVSYGVDELARSCFHFTHIQNKSPETGKFTFPYNSGRR